MVPTKHRLNHSQSFDTSTSFYCHSSTTSNSTCDFHTDKSTILNADFSLHKRPHTAEHFPVDSAGPFRNKKMREVIGVTTEDEFEALPIAVKRKYFSTLERLRFAQNLNDQEQEIENDTRLGPIRRKASLADRRGLKSPVVDSSKRYNNSRRLRKNRQGSTCGDIDASWFLTLPDKIKKKEFTRAEQIAITGRYRDRVVLLDAADEAVYKASNRTSRLVNVKSLDNLNFDDDISSTDNDMLSIHEDMPAPPGTNAAKLPRPTSFSKEMIENFRWMDEEEDLDLRLVLDDYHANLDGAVIPSPSSTVRPSFRKHVSISSLPFGRNSISTATSSQPSSRDTPTPNSSRGSQSRRLSKRMSMLLPKPVINISHNSSPSIDHTQATHYQDPEARLKLRVYLGSPQKFDEAIEFGFPSMDGVTETSDNKENEGISRSNTRKSSRDIGSRKRTGPSVDMQREKTFLNDDTVSLTDTHDEDEDDDASMDDPDSPQTPAGAGFEQLFKTGPPTTRPAFVQRRANTSMDFGRAGVRRPMLHKHAESFAPSQSPRTSCMSNREMTLRMTLTRPDLRADENLLYGWQGSVRTKSSLGQADVRSESDSLVNEKLGPFGGPDGWGIEKDENPVKRFWNRAMGRSS